MTKVKLPLGFFTNYWSERRALKAIKKAQTEAAREARLTPDGLDPEDPNDQLRMSIMDNARQQREQERRKYRREQVRQIAYRLMEEAIHSVYLDKDPEQSAKMQTLADHCYRKATIIYATIEEAEKIRG